MSATCYCCNEAATGQGDHVPPLALFAPGTFASSRPIIVPSCAAHNEAQSAADEYLRYVLASSASVVPKEVRNGVVRSVIRHAKNPNASLHRFGMERTDRGLSIGPGAPVNAGLLDQALAKVARGIYYHHHRGSKKLMGDVEVHPVFLGIEKDAPAEIHQFFARLSSEIIESLKTLPVYGDHQEVFAYQVLDAPNSVTINMLFYGSKIASVIKSIWPRSDF